MWNYPVYALEDSHILSNAIAVGLGSHIDQKSEIEYDSFKSNLVMNAGSFSNPDMSFFGRSG